MEDVTISVSEFVALVNQTLEFAYPVVRVEGEVSEFRISKGKWVYFNLQDQHSSVRMFGTVYQLKQPIEDGMKVVVKGTPRLHNKYGFSLNVSSINPSGEGSIKRAFELLKKKLEDEGLFDESRKRQLPQNPTRIGLITSEQAAAYGDFMKIINQRWAGLEIQHANVQVQGEAAPAQIIRAIQYFSESAQPVDVIVVTRGGGSTEDLMAFSDEGVARAIASSRIPTIVGVGHEMDVSLADLVADVRATTPTNAAQIVVRDKQEVLRSIDYSLRNVAYKIEKTITAKKQLSATILDRLEDVLSDSRNSVDENMARVVRVLERQLEAFESKRQLLESKIALINPKAILGRGYAIVTSRGGAVLTNSKQVKVGDILMVQLNKGNVESEVRNVKN